MDVAILSDTHIPSRARAVPERFRDHVASTDHVIHAGDFVSADALGEVRDMAGELTAVSGNMDGDLGLPTTATVDLEGLTVAVTHGTGPMPGYGERVIETAHRRDADAVVAGHTHEVVDRTRGGVRVLNPGSATGAAPASRTTMMTAAVSAGGLDVELREM